MGRREARNSAKIAGPAPMPRILRAMARTARGGMVLPTLKNCMKRSALSTRCGRLNAMPAGMPTANAAAIEASTSTRCACR
ncbi:hypothetical protein D3C78_1417790 [compost metagenome]